MPAVVLQLFHSTKNLVGQVCSIEQGSALVPLRPGIGGSTVAAFQSTFMHYNDLASSILTAHGVPSSSSVACTVSLKLRAERVPLSVRAPSRHMPSSSKATGPATTDTRSGSPRICYSSEHIAHAVASGREFQATLSEYYRPVSRLRPLRRNLGEIQFASFVENGTLLPGYMFYNTLEPQVVQEAVIEQAVLTAALAVRPVPTSTEAGEIAALRGYVESEFAKANPTALFQNALQLPAVACPYIQDEVEIPSNFRSPDMTGESDHHRVGLTDTYAQMAISGTGGYDSPEASGDCEDRSDMTSFDIGMNAQAYVLAHRADPPTTLSYWVARALVAVLDYTPFAALCSLDESNIDSHMVALFVRRALLPERFRVPPWGEVPLKAPHSASALPAAIYMDSTYFTPTLPLAAEKGARAFSALFERLVAGNRAVEGVISITDQPWLSHTNPAQRFVVARLFTDVRNLQTRPYQPGVAGATAWLRPVFDPHSSARLVPVMVPTDKRHPGTYGISLIDLCKHGDKIADFVPHTVPVRQWNEMLLCLAFRHPPVPIRMELTGDRRRVVCTEITVAAGHEGQADPPPAYTTSVFAVAHKTALSSATGPAPAASDARSVDLVYPVIVRSTSFTPQVQARITNDAAQAWHGKAYRTFRTRAVLNDMSGTAVITSFVV